jgi:hypothetical protein
MTDIQFVNEIEWDGTSLAVWAATPRGRVLCEVRDDPIHTLGIYNDAIERESTRDRHDIFERLRPAIVAKIARTALEGTPTENSEYFSLRTKAKDARFYALRPGL